MDKWVITKSHGCNGKKGNVIKEGEWYTLNIATSKDDYELNQQDIEVLMAIISKAQNLTK